MRFIIREQEYEHLLAAGRLEYELAGQPTGALETWRLTEVIDGYRFLRVDLDAREAESGNSTLYHLALNPHGRAERLKFRFYGKEREILGDVLLDESVISVSREVNGRRFVDEVAVPANYAFWFPSTMGLGLLASSTSTSGRLAAVTLLPDQDFSAVATEVRWDYGEEEQIVVTRQTVAVRRCLIRWNDQQRTVWLDSDLLPVMMERDDGLKAMERRYVRHRMAKQNRVQL